MRLIPTLPLWAQSQSVLRSKFPVQPRIHRETLSQQRKQIPNKAKISIKVTWHEDSKNQYVGKIETPVQFPVCHQRYFIIYSELLNILDPTHILCLTLICYTGQRHTKKSFLCCVVCVQNIFWSQSRKDVPIGQWMFPAVSKGKNQDDSVTWELHLAFRVKFCYLWNRNDYSINLTKLLE